MLFIVRVRVILGCTVNVQVYRNLCFNSLLTQTSHINVLTVATSHYESVVDNMKSIISSLEQQVKTLETKSLSNANPTYASATASSSSTNPQPTAVLPTSAYSPPNDHIKIIVSSYLIEEKEKSKRQLNIIVHNLKESSSEDGATRKKDDVSKVNELLQNHMEVNPTKSNAIRLGKRGKRPRLLRITVSTEAEKANVLRNMFKLHKEEKLNQEYIYYT